MPARNPCTNPRCKNSYHFSARCPNEPAVVGASGAERVGGPRVRAVTDRQHAAMPDLPDTPSGSGESLDAANRMVAGEDFEFVDDSGPVTRVYIANQGGTVGGPYAERHAGAMAAVRIEGVGFVMADNYGYEGTYNLADGTPRRSWICPSSEDKDDMAHLLTPEQFDELEHAAEVAHEAGYLENVDPDNSMDDVTRSALLYDRLSVLGHREV